MQLYVPYEMEENIIRLTHEKYGHFGVDKCMIQNRKHYWFPGMKEKIEKFIPNCLKCIYYTGPRQNSRNMYPIEKVSVHYAIYSFLCESTFHSSQPLGGRFI